MKGLSENLEDYLETILVLQNENTVARVKDIAEKLGVLSGTVTSALRTLSDKKLINYKPYSFITLTNEGKTLADMRASDRREKSRRECLQNGTLNGQNRR
jgi:DtxR family Mn-dependent transcriptional regulator